MKTPRFYSFVISILIAGAHVFGDDPSPTDIMKKVSATYKSLTTYQAEGLVTIGDHTDEAKQMVEISFSILLKKPNLYLISWDHKKPESAGSGTVWNDGEQPYLYLESMKSFSKLNFTNTGLTLSFVSGICGGAALTIPRIILSGFEKQEDLFSHLKNLRIEKIESFDDEDCFVLSGSTSSSQKEIFWISKSSYLIKKHFRSHELPEEPLPSLEISDKQMAEMIKGMGLEVTEESKNNVAEMLESGEKIMGKRDKANDAKFSTLEIHKNISSPELEKKDFVFVPPEGTILKDSLFSEIFQEK